MRLRTPLQGFLEILSRPLQCFLLLMLIRIQAFGDSKSRLPPCTLQQIACHLRQKQIVASIPSNAP